jgi:hypothetical protein
MKGKNLDKLIDRFSKEVKNPPKIESDVNTLSEKIDNPLKMSYGGMDNYQRITKLEMNAKRILEKLAPLTEVQVGI